MTTFLVALLLAFVVYAVFALTMYKLQRRLVYRTDSRRVPPHRIGLSGVSEVTLQVPEGESLIAWHGVAEPGKPTMLYFHGQAGNLARRSERVRRYRSAGLGILIMAYRGFSGSSGQPSETANVADALFAYDWLSSQGVAAKDIVIYGESLGTGVAVQVASARPASGLVLDSPFTTLSDLAAARHPFLPVRPFMLDRYETVRHVPGISAPTLVLQGEKDPIVPLAMACQVFDALSAPKRLITYAEGRHLDHGRYGSFDAVLRFLDNRTRWPQGYRKVERVAQASAATAAQATVGVTPSAARA
jgi:fermentation-respiration switch protein FrsA (DUF1100 family)